MIQISNEQNPYEDQRYLTLTWRGDITTEKDPHDPTTTRLTALNGATSVEKLLLNSALGRCTPEDPELYKRMHELNEDFTFAIYDSAGNRINPQRLPLMPGARLTLELSYRIEAVEDSYPGDQIEPVIQRKRSSPYIQHIQEAVKHLGIHANGTLKEHWSNNGCD